MKEINIFSRKSNAPIKDQLAVLKGASTVIFTLSENNPHAHITPSVRWSYVISLPDTRSYLNIHWFTRICYVSRYFFSDLGSLKGPWKRARFLWSGISQPLFIPTHASSQQKNMRSLFGSGNDPLPAASCPPRGLLRVSHTQYTQVLKLVPVQTNNKAGVKIIAFVGPAHPPCLLAQEAAAASPHLRGAVFHSSRWQPHSCHSHRVCMARLLFLPEQCFFFFFCNYFPFCPQLH